MTHRFPMGSIAGDVVSLRSAMDRLFNESFVPGVTPVGQSHGMPLNAYATEEEVVVIAAIPGMDADDIHITIDKNTVTLSGSVPDLADAEDTKGVSWLLHELPSGSFERSLTLPFELDANRANATFDDGLLRLSLPKAESEKPKQIKVSVGGKKPIDVGTESTDS